MVLVLSLDRPLSFRILGLARRLSGAQVSSESSSIVSDLLTKNVVRKVKVSKVGDYLIITLVLRAGIDSGTEVEIEEPLVLFSDGDAISSIDSSREPVRT